MMRHDIDCEADINLRNGRVPGMCFCDVRADVHRFQAENRDRLDAATDPEKDAVLRWLNDHDPDVLREAMDETGVDQ